MNNAPKKNPNAWHPTSTSRTTSFAGVLAVTGRGDAATAVWHFPGAVDDGSPRPNETNDQCAPFWGKFWGLPKSFQIFLLLRGDLVEMRGFFLVELGWDEFCFDLGRCFKVPCRWMGVTAGGIRDMSAQASR